MVDPGDWGFLAGIFVTWVGLALLLVAFLAGAANVRRRQGARVAQILSDERDGRRFEPIRVQALRQRGRALLRRLVAPKR
jgi:hypothetical protein